MSDPRSWIHREIDYRGRVQGVGFRFTTVRIAAGYDITGFVQNMPDGSVRVVVEGRPSELDRFQATLGEAMRGCIRDAQAAESAATGGFDHFTIRY